MISTSAASTRTPASPIASTMSSSPTSSPRKNPRPRSTFTFKSLSAPRGRREVNLPRQLPHPAVDAVKGQREHALFQQLTDHADAGGAAPVFLRHRVEPHRLGIGIEQAAQPGLARLVVPALDAAALLLDLVGAHAGVADQHEFVAGIVGAQDFHHVDLLDMPSP